MRVQLTRILARTHPRADSEGGAIAIIVAILSVVLLLMAAFAVDIGNAYAVKRQLSVAADAAALDAARAVATAKSGGVPILGGGRGCSTWTPTQAAAAQAAAQSAATATNASNDKSGESTVDKVTVTCVGDSRVEVSVDNSRNLPVFFGGIANAGGYKPARSATAAVIPRLAVGGLRPYAACNTVVDAAAASPGTTFVMDLDNQIGLCNSTAAGNWGIVDFDGGSNPTGDIRAWTGSGYPNPLDAPSSDLPGDPGANLGPVTTQLDSLIDQIVLFPVVTGYTPGSGSGSNGRFDLVGFVGAKVCAYYLSNTQYNYGSCYDAAKAAPYQSARPRVRFIQFQYVDYTTSYSGGGATCNFTDPKCKFAILGAQLYR
jgi:Flp pilus assembly protein TadG